jgi:hypothetical protein
MNWMYINWAETLDWTSIKLTGGTVILGIASGNKTMIILSAVALVSTIAYNAIRIYKELKKKK